MMIQQMMMINLVEWLDYRSNWEWPISPRKVHPLNSETQPAVQEEDTNHNLNNQGNNDNDYWW